MHTIFEQTRFIPGGINMVLSRCWQEGLVGSPHLGKYLTQIQETLVVIVASVPWSYHIISLGHACLLSFYRNVRDIWPMKHKQAKTACPLPMERFEAPGLLTFPGIAMEANIKKDFCPWAILRAQLLAEPEKPKKLLCLVMVILKVLFMQHNLTYPDQSTSNENQPSFVFYCDFPQGHSGLKPRGLPREESGNG